VIPNWKPLLLSVAGAFLLQLTIVAAISLHLVAAAFLAILSTITLAWRGTWMVEMSPPMQPRYSTRRIFNLLSVTTTLILLNAEDHPRHGGKRRPLLESRCQRR
jgi:hypothetical protein